MSCLVKWLLFGLLIFCTECALTKEITVKIGMVSLTDNYKSYQLWQPLLDRLKQGLPQYDFQFIVGDIDTIDFLTQNDKLDFIIANPLRGLFYRDNYQAYPLLSLAPVNGNAKNVIASSVITLKDKVLPEDWSQLRAVHVISTSPQAFGGFQILQGEWLKLGIDPFTDFKRIDFVGTPQEKVLHKLLQNEADIAILPACILEQFLDKYPELQQKFKVLFVRQQTILACQVSSTFYSGPVLLAASHAKAKIKEQIYHSLKNGPKMILRTRYESYFQWIEPVFDTRSIALYHLLGLDSGKNSVKVILNRYQQEIIIVIFIIGLLLLHNGYIRFRIRQKSRELACLYTENEQKNKQIYAAQRILLSGELASSLVHELSQPLMAMGNYILGAQYRVKQNNVSIEDIHVVFTQLTHQLQTIKSITMRVKEFCKRREGYAEPIILDSLLRHCIAFFEYELRQQEISCKFDIEKKIMVFADRILLQQVFINILCNAIDALKYCDNKKKQINLVAVKTQDHIIIQIEDNGCGMDKRQLEAIFLPFNSSKNNGLGLGMMICKNVIEQAQGEISVNSRLNIGTEITIILPTIGRQK